MNLLGEFLGGLNITGQLPVVTRTIRAAMRRNLSGWRGEAEGNQRGEYDFKGY